MVPQSVQVVVELELNNIVINTDFIFPHGHKSENNQNILLCTRIYFFSVSLECMNLLHFVYCGSLVLYKLFFPGRLIKWKLH